MNEQTKAIMEVISQHTLHIGVSASPNFWAHKARMAGQGQWFAYCQSDGRVDEEGCGWDSEPHTFYTRREAREAAAAHLAEKIEAVL